MADALEFVSRREFLNYLLSGGGMALIVATLYPIVRYIMPPKGAEVMATSVVAAQVDELALNAAKVFRFGTKPAILIHSSPGMYKAFTAVCTHLNCTVQYKSESSHIHCACHNGHFDLNGQVISGPPPKPLEEFQVNIRGEDVVVSKA